MKPVLMKATLAVAAAMLSIGRKPWTAVLIGGDINQHTNEIMTWTPNLMPDLR